MKVGAGKFAHGGRRAQRAPDISVEDTVDVEAR